MSSWFTLEGKADEWLDVTPNEELLQNELNSTKKALEKNSEELQETSRAVDLLKGHKSLLESERESFQSELKQSKKRLSQIEKELEEANQRNEFLKNKLAATSEASELKTKHLENSLDSCKEELGEAHKEIASLNEKADALKSRKEEEKTGFDAQAGELNRVISSLRTQANDQASMIARYEKALRDSRDLVTSLRRDLAEQKREFEMQRKRLVEAETNASAATLFAEEMNAKKTLLEQTLQMKEKALNLSNLSMESLRTSEGTLRKELDAAKKLAEDRTAVINDLQQSRLASETVTDELKKSLGRLQAECADWKEEADRWQQRLAVEKAAGEKLLEEAIGMKEELNRLQALQKDAETQSAREKYLEAELEHQKEAYEHRLHEVREILGMNPSKLLSKSLTFDVPLLMYPQSHYS